MIALLDPSAESKMEWDTYVNSHDSGTPFHLTAWGDAIQRAFGHENYYWFARNGGRICGVLPLTHVKSRLFGNVMSSAGFAAYGGKLPANTYARWVVLAVSLILMGFVLKRPISLTNINSLLVGYWPRWQENVYWYLLLAAVLLPVILKGKTPYCTNICPFSSIINT